MKFEDQMHMPMRLVTAYGLETAPCATYVKHSKMIATEYIVKFAGKKRRVYNWITEDGRSKMYVLWHGAAAFVTDEIEAMLTRGNPSYDGWTMVAQSVTVAS